MADLDHVLWIGGPAASGKTTVARRLACRHGLRWYNSDAMTWKHRDRALRAGNPGAHRWETWRATAPAQRGSLSDEDMLAMSLHRERGPMTLDDLRALPTTPLIVAEGTQITPRIVPRNGSAVWLIPCGQVQRRRWEQKHGPEGWSGWALAIGQAIRDEVQAARRRVLVVDDLDEDQTLHVVESLFGDMLVVGPTATTATERRVLLRYANKTILEQCQAFLARRWANDESSVSTRSFLCECGDPECQATVDLAIVDFPIGTPPGADQLLASGHVLTS